MTAKSVLMRSQGLRPGARTPTCYATAPETFAPGHVSPLATPLGAKAKTVHLLSLFYYSTLTLNQINVLT